MKMKKLSSGFEPATFCNAAANDQAPHDSKCFKSLTIWRQALGWILDPGARHQVAPAMLHIENSNTELSLDLVVRRSAMKGYAGLVSALASTTSFFYTYIKRILGQGHIRPFEFRVFKPSRCLALCKQALREFHLLSSPLSPPLSPSHPPSLSHTCLSVLLQLVFPNEQIFFSNRLNSPELKHNNFFQTRETVKLVSGPDTSWPTFRKQRKSGRIQSR